MVPPHFFPRIILINFVYISFLVKCSAEVTCSDAIRQARVTRVSSVGLRKLAKVKLSRSESGAHHVFSKYGQSIDLKISRTDLPSKRGFPYVSFVNWLRYLVEYDQLEHLVGVQDLNEMNKILVTFCFPALCVSHI